MFFKSDDSNGQYARKPMKIHIGTLTSGINSSKSMVVYVNASNATIWFVMRLLWEKLKTNFYVLLRWGVVKRVEIRLPFDFRSTTFVSFRFLCSEFLCRSLSPHTHSRTCFLLAETLLSWDLPEVEARSTTPQSNCLCQTSSCLCCVDLNLTATIDLGGPACVNIKQKEQNVSLNLSYGDNPVHNATIRIGK